MSITPTNYYGLVTDLVGLRALQLFKEASFTIDRYLKSKWSPSETPKAYVREGDPEHLTNLFNGQGFEVEMHPKGYRSIHYIFSTQPFQRKVFTEVQVRTIFEEGWSEIDHQVRYPNFSDDRLVSYFLTIFNRLAGSADEMGTFVKDLTSSLGKFEKQLKDANDQREQVLFEMGEVLGELQAMKVKDSTMEKKLSAMQIELSKIRQLSQPLTIFSDTGRTQLGGLASLGATNHFANLSFPSTTSDTLFLRVSSNESVKFTETLNANDPFKNKKKEKPR